MKKISIMLIDDHTLIRESWRSLLIHDKNMEVIAECGDGRLAGGLSMRSEPANVKQFLRLGAKGYVTKKSPRKEMIHAIEEVNKGNRYTCAEVRTLLAEQKIEGDSKAPDLNCLSGSELGVLSPLCAGANSKEIAEKLGMAVKTVEVHRNHILKKMKVKTTLALILYVKSRAFEI
jgi:DNA-binding NarL/FixJ family response regulator